MNDENITIELCNIFESNKGSLTVTKVRDILCTKKINIPEYEINEHLLELQSKGIVRFNNGFWHNPKRNIVSASSTTESWSPSKSKLLLSFPNIDFKSLEDVAKTDVPEISFESSSSEWGLFRKLTNYYIDCVANDSGCEAHSFSDKHNEDFIFLNLKGRWYPEANIKWALFLFINSPEFFKKLSKIGNDFSLVLGYPVQFWEINKEEALKSSIVKPVFTYKVDFEFKPGGLEISCDNPFPEINLDWLESTFKSSEQQKHFLSSCGMMGNIEEDSVDGVKNIFPDFPDFKKLALAAQNFLKVKEPLNSDFITDNVDFETVSNGIYNKAVLMIASRSNYSKNLLKELSEIGKASDKILEKTALKYIFKLNNSNASDIKPQLNVSSKVINTTDLNAEQIDALESLVNKNITVITGPPGTGKSQVVSSAVENLRLKEQSILFASRNHKAIDAVLNKVDPSFIIRCNSKEDPNLKENFVKALDRLLSQSYKKESFQDWKHIADKLNDKIVNREKMTEDLKLVNDLGAAISKHQYDLDLLMETIQISGELKDKKFDNDLLDKIMVALEKINRLSGVSGPPSILFKLFACIKALLGINKIWRLNSLVKVISDQYLLSGNVLSFDNICSNHAKIAEISSIVSYFKIINNVEEISDKLKGLPAKDDLTAKLSRAIAEIIDLSKIALNKDLDRRQGIEDSNNRELLTNLKSALKGLINPVIDDNVQSGIMKTLENNSGILLHHFPAWAVTNLSIGSRIPLLPGIFDLAVVDEASQCDIASVIPILFRAKRIAAVGDPKQLSQTTKISRSRDTMLRKRNNLIKLEEQRFSYPDNSFYDLMASGRDINPIMLKDHYRCDEAIASYCNDSFYRGELRVYTNANKFKIPRSFKKGIIWNEVVSKITHGGSSGCYSSEECDAAVSIAKKILNEDNFEGSIGIVTPFRQQAVRINDIIQSEISYEKRMISQLKVDTAHGFQGDERDVIILSLCAGLEMPSGSLNFLRETSNLLNVAVSRARASLIIVGNKKWASSCRIPHIERLTAEYKHKREFTEKDSPWYPHQSPWEKKVYEALLKIGIETVPQYEVRGRFLDLAYVKNGKKVDIEIDGETYHRNSDGTRKIDDYYRDITLLSDDWKIIRFWVYKLKEDFEKCIDKVVKTIE